MAWLDLELYGYREITDNGSAALEQQPTLNFVRCVVANNPAQNRTDVTIPLATTLLPGLVNTIGVSGQLLTSDGLTAGGVWALLPAASVAPGAAWDTLRTNSLGTLSEWGTIVNAQIDAAADIDVSKLGSAGAANTFLQDTGAAVQWRAYSAWGAGPPAAGSLRFSQGTTAQGLDAATTGTAPVFDWGSTTADWVTVGGNDADLDGVAIVGGAAGQVTASIGAVALQTWGAAAVDFPSAVGVTATGNPAWNFGNGQADFGGNVDANAGLDVTGNLTVSAEAYIGAAAPSGSEVFRVTGGSVLVDGAVGAVPVAGAGTRLMFCPAKYAFRAGLVDGTQWNDANVGLGSVAIGANSTASGSSATAFGLATSAGGTGAFSGGLASNASANYSFAHGYYCAASGAYGFAQGRLATATLLGQDAHSGGSVNVVAGEFQRSSVAVIRESTDAGAVELTLSSAAPGAGTRLLVRTGTLYRFRIAIGLICSAGTDVGDCAGWEIHGCVKNIGGTTALVGSPLNLTGAGWSAVVWTPQWSDAFGGAGNPSVAIAADDPNDCLTVTCTGVAPAAGNNTYHWNATVYLCEVM